jgi:hypothetical protein
LLRRPAGLSDSPHRPHHWASPSGEYLFSGLADVGHPVEDDLEEVPSSGIPFGLVEAGQVADEEDDVAGVDVGADGAFGLADGTGCPGRRLPAW